MMIDDTLSSLGRHKLYRYVIGFITVRSKRNQKTRVKTAVSRRRYRSDLRERQAADTRHRVIAGAATLFAERGYTRTTLSAIAAAAGVSTETVQAQGSKASLLIAALELAAVGATGAVSIFDLDVGRRFLAISDRDGAMDYFVAEQTAAHERSVRLLRALYVAAAEDPELQHFLVEVVAGVSRQIRGLLAVCRERGWLRRDVDFDELVGTGVVLASVDTYVRLVQHEGWTVEAFRGWFRRTLDAAILAPPGAPPSRRVRRGAA